MKVLVIDDDEHITAFLSSHLSGYGFAIDVVHGGRAGIQAAQVNEYDLVLLDLHLPDVNGGEVVKALHQFGTPPPILMLTVISDAWSKVELLNAGADDYLIKPFLLEELVSRMRALLRRSPQLTPEVLTAGYLTLDTRSRIVRRFNKEIELTGKEFSILEYLIRNTSRLVPKTELIEHVWNSESDPFSAAVETHLANLRRKLGEPNCIRTIHGQGYRIEG